MPKEILKKQALAFAITGTLSTALMFLIYIGLNKLINYQVSYLIAYVVSVVALYFMNVFFVFKTTVSWKGFLKFPFIYVLQYLVGAFSLEILIRHGIPKDLAPILIIIILLPITFALNRWVLL
jgi:putative flippase GtrA